MLSKTFKKSSTKILFIFVLVSLFAIGVFTAAAIDYGRISGMALLNGNAAADFQKAFGNKLFFRRFSIQCFARIRFNLFHEGLPGVSIGNEGWLFSTEEFSDDLGVLTTSLRNAVSETRDILRCEGIDLVVIPVPAKARIYSEHLSFSSLKSLHKDRYDKFLSVLDSLGIPRVDVSSRFSEKAIEGEALFLKTDTHWSPAGSKIAAEMVAELVSRILEDKYTEKTTYRSRFIGEEILTGDLMAFLPKKSTFFRKLPEPDRIQRFLTVSVIEAGNLDVEDLFGIQNIPVALVGTSYSADERWNFEGFLKESLGMDVLNLSGKGRGPFEPMKKAIETGILTENNVKIVVWEIPERYIPESRL